MQVCRVRLYKWYQSRLSTNSSVGPLPWSGASSRVSMWAGQEGWQPSTVERKANEIICRDYTLTLHEAFRWIEAHKKQNRREARWPKRTISCMCVGWGITPILLLREQRVA